MGNPLTEESADLLVLDTKDVADASVVKTVEEAETLGQEQFETFVKERLREEKTKNMNDPMKKNKLPLFRSPCQREPSKDKQQISSLKSDCAPFSRLLISYQTREGDLDDFFKHKNQGFPPSISQNGKLRLPGKKSDLTDCIQSLSQPRTRAPTPIDAAIIDGAAAINMVKPTNTVKTFQEYADLVFIPYVKGQLQHVQRLDIIWDEYVPNSLKATTRGKRGRGIRRRVQSLTTVSKNWKEFLRVDANKKELFGFLAEQIPLVDFGDGKQVIATKGEETGGKPSQA